MTQHPSMLYHGGGVVHKELSSSLDRYGVFDTKEITLVSFEEPSGTAVLYRFTHEQETLCFELCEEELLALVKAYQAHKRMRRRRAASPAAADFPF